MRPKILITLLAAAILVAGSILLGGCRSNADAEARELINQANTDLENAAKEFEKMEELKKRSAEVDIQNIDENTVSEAKVIIEQFEASAEKALNEVEAARLEFQKALNKKISNDMKTYLNLKLDALDNQVAMLKKLQEALELRSELFAALQQDITAEMYEYFGRIAELDKAVAELAEEAEAGLRDANEFYKEKGLDK